MILATLALTASINASVAVEIDLSKLFRRSSRPEAVQGLKCNIRTVGYRFAGKPGQRFQYAGEVYEIPREGWVELIADGGPESYRMEGRTLPLGVWPLDPFGFRVVDLPNESSAPEVIR